MCQISWFQILRVCTSNVSAPSHPSSTAEGPHRVQQGEIQWDGTIWLCLKIRYPGRPKYAIMFSLSFMASLGPYPSFFWFIPHLHYIQIVSHYNPLRVYRYKHQMAVWVHLVHHSIPRCWPKQETPRSLRASMTLSPTCSLKTSSFLGEMFGESFDQGVGPRLLATAEAWWI